MDEKQRFQARWDSINWGEWSGSLAFPVIDIRRDFTHGDLPPLPEYQGAVVPSKGVSATGHVIYPDFISKKQGTEIIKKKS